MGKGTSRLVNCLFCLGFIGLLAFRFVGEAAPRFVCLIFMVVAFGALLCMREPLGKAPADMLAVLCTFASLGSFRLGASLLALDAAGLAWFVLYLVKRRKSESYVADRHVVVGFAAATTLLFVVDLMLAG